jgi:hypothetical protein
MRVNFILPKKKTIFLQFVFLFGGNAALMKPSKICFAVYALPGPKYSPF